MSVGFPANKVDIDARAGQLALQLRDVFAQIGALQAWLAGKSTEDLQALGYTSGEADIVKSSYSDLDELRTIYEGTANLSVAKDFRIFAHQLTGVI